MAWLGAVPRPPEPPPGAKPGAAEPKTRLETMKEKGETPPLAFVEMPDFISWLMEVGPTEPAGMANGPISWGEINAWCDGTGPDLMPWQRRLLRKLSKEYVAESRRAEDPTAAMPDVEGTIDRDAIGKSARNAMASWKKRSGS